MPNFLDSRLLMMLVGTLALASCNLRGGVDAGETPEPDGDHSREEPREDSGSDVPDSDTEGIVSPPGGGPLLLIVSEARITTERRCDFDGDGIGNNAIADVGPPFAEILETTINALVAGTIENGRRMALYLPWVNDLSGPTTEEALTLMLQLVDPDALLVKDDYENPIHREDDFSGEEPFYAAGDSLDSCGEPRFYTRSAHLDAGELEIDEAEIAVPIAESNAILRGAELTGHVNPFGRSFEILVCGSADIPDLGAQPGLSGADLTLLEELLLGGAALGVDTLRGLVPDVDNDGDGLERFVRDDDGHIESCIDGDLASIPGRDCWSDPRIADGIALDFVLNGTSARYAGREPAWEQRIVGNCPDGPPEEGLLDNPLPPDGECVAVGELCDPLLEEAACCDGELLCAGAFRAPYRCSRRCDAEPCRHGAWPGICLTTAHTAEGQGVCWPHAHPPELPSCPTDSAPCDPQLEPAGEAVCVGGECWPSCTLVPHDCPEDKSCLPLVFDDGGVCVEVW